MGVVWRGDESAPRVKDPDTLRITHATGSVLLRIGPNGWPSGVAVNCLLALCFFMGMLGALLGTLVLS